MLLAVAVFVAGATPGAARSKALLPDPGAAALSQPGYADLGADQGLAPLFPEGAAADLEGWERLRVDLRGRWERLLGRPGFEPDGYERAAEVLERFEAPDFRGTLLRQATGPGTAQLVLLMEPLGGAATKDGEKEEEGEGEGEEEEEAKRPGAVVPFYHPDAMAGFDLGKRERITAKRTTQFGRHLVQQGYVVVCTEAFPYNLVPAPETERGLSRWKVAAEKLLHDNPDWTGMGKLVHDTRRGLDLLLEQPGVDREKVLVIGHSLGGKMAFYTGCLDDRVKATIATDFGIGWDFTNWHDIWYLGPQVRDPEFPLAHHQLLALHAPRPFLLVAGQYDKPESWQYLNAARPAYARYPEPGARHALGMIDHASGHQPTEASMRLAYRWLAEQFGLAPRPWEL